MKVIDSDNYAASGIDAFFFPGGEPHARIPENFGPALLFLKARTWNDVGKAVCVLAALWEQGYSKAKPVWLFAAYLPGARQDRTDYRTPVTKDIISQLLGAYVNRLYTFDIHSHTDSGVHFEKNFMPLDLTEAGEYNHKYFVIAPDKGAVERARELSNLTPNDLIICEKTRNFASGKFTGFKLPPLPRVGNYVIVDDICDGGGTFNLLAEEFLKDPCGPRSTLSLWVSHGIFSQGLNAIHAKITQITTTDSWARLGTTGTMQDPKRLDVVSLQPIIDKILKKSEDV